MKLYELLSLYTNDNFYISINGLCEEWAEGVEALKNEPYFEEYRNKKVTSLAILDTNNRPELCIEVSNIGLWVEDQIVNCSDYDMDEVKRHCKEISDLEREVFDVTEIYSHLIDASNIEIVLYALTSCKLDIKKYLKAAKDCYEVE